MHGGHGGRIDHGGDNVRECYEAVREIFANELPGYDYEHIFCDNASKDDTIF